MWYQIVVSYILQSKEKYFLQAITVEEVDRTNRKKRTRQLHTAIRSNAEQIDDDGKVISCGLAAGLLDTCRGPAGG